MFAPDLSEIGNAGREDEWLFNYIYDARVYNPETVMPPWGSHGFFDDQEINDMVAFLKTLKSPAAFKTELDDPTKRPPPVEKRDNLDSIENPAMWAVDKAQELWNEKGSAGFSCNSCHSDPKTSFKVWAASMPKWEPRLNKALNVEEFVTRHAKATTGANWLMETDENRVMSVYLHFLANGTPIKIDTSSPEAKAALERGKELSARKVGQLNMACTDCHGKVANHWIRGQWLGEPKGQYDHFPTWRTSSWRSGISASGSSGVRSISALTNCHPMPRNMAISNSILPLRTRGRSSAYPASDTRDFRQRRSRQGTQHQRA